MGSRLSGALAAPEATDLVEVVHSVAIHPEKGPAAQRRRLGYSVARRLNATRRLGG